MRKFIDKLTNEVQSTINQAGNWSGYGPPNGAGGAGGYGYPAPGPNLGHSPVTMPQATTPCPRQQPQAGFTDWIGLGDARFAAFNVCPSCYSSVIRPTPYAGSFFTKAGTIAPPPHVPVRCDMSRYWVRVAGMVLLTMNQDRQHDITLLARVAGIRAQDGECPNADVAGEYQPLPVVRRNWYTIQDPTTGAQPLPGWTVCAACVIAMQACCPAVAAAFAPVQPVGARDASCSMVPSGRYDDQRTGMILQQVGACEVLAKVTRRADMGQLLGWLRANPPPARSGVAPPAGVGSPGVGVGGPGSAPGMASPPPGFSGTSPGVGSPGPGPQPGIPGMALPGAAVPSPPPVTGAVSPGAPGGYAHAGVAPQAPGIPVMAPGMSPPAPSISGAVAGGFAVGGPCPRNVLSTTARCHTMQGLFDLTVCEQCYNTVIKPDADRGVELARRFDGNASAMPSGFTCQLYSERMRRVWTEAVSAGDFEHLRRKVIERRTKERELQMKTGQAQQRAAQLREQASLKQHLAINAMRLSSSTASNNIMLSGMGIVNQVDANHYTRLSGVPDFSQTNQLNNEAVTLKMQAAQTESEAAMAQEEWRRYWE